MNKLLLGGLAGLAGLALFAGAAARAADMPAAPVVKAPPPIMDWGGFYVGGHFGGALSDIHFSFLDDQGNSEDLRFGPASYFGGVQLGAQWQFYQWILGFEGTWSATGLNRTDASTVTAGEFTSLKVDDIATATVRFGAVWDRALFYAKAGYAAAHVNVHSVDNATALIADSTGWRPGWTVGAGVDFMVWDNVILGAEFDYFNFNFDNTNGIYNDGATPFAISSTNGNIYAFVARASYLFR
jgi:outer membrane immunogenic protein